MTLFKHLWSPSPCVICFIPILDFSVPHLFVAKCVKVYRNSFIVCIRFGAISSGFNLLRGIPSIFQHFKAFCHGAVSVFVCPVMSKFGFCIFAILAAACSAVSLKSNSNAQSEAHPHKHRQQHGVNLNFVRGALVVGGGAAGALGMALGSMGWSKSAQQFSKSDPILCGQFYFQSSPIMILKEVYGRFGRSW